MVSLPRAEQEARARSSYAPGARSGRVQTFLGFNSMYPPFPYSGVIGVLVDLISAAVSGILSLFGLNES